MAMEESSPVMSCAGFDDLHRNLSQEDGGKAAAQQAGPDGLLPGWVRGSYSCTVDKNGEIHSMGTCKDPIPMCCFLCGALCDHWPKNCPSKIRPESTINFKLDQKVFLPTE